MKNFTITDFALQRPISVIMISISLIGLGIVAWNRMPLKFLPEIDQPFMGCQIPYPGASPRQVEQEIAIPVEGEFQTIQGLQQIRTISNENGCFVSMIFSLDTDMSLATSEVRDRMERLKLVLPEEADRMIIQRFSTQSLPVLAIGVFHEGDQERFTHNVRTLLEPRLRRVPGVADVQVRTPVLEKEVLIEFDQDTLRSMNLALAQVVSVLRQASLNISVGSLTEGNSRYLVRALGEYRRLDDLKELIVSPTGLRLKDVAKVSYDTRGDQAFVSLDGKGGAVLLVVKESEANAVETCEAARAEFEAALREPIFEGTEQMLFFDQSELITGALDNLLHEGIYGALMAIGVLLVFLHRLTPTIIVALNIPCSLVVVLVFMFFAGMSLNLVTMVSLIISVGMLVDNAIVIVENIMRHRELGESPLESARKGASEVGLAVTVSTLTSVVVFLPMFYLEAGQMSVFMAQLGFPLIVAQFGSLVVALALVPLTMSKLRNVQADGGSEGASEGGKDRPPLLARFFAAFGRFQVVRRTVDAYSWSLSFFLRQRLAALVLLAGMTVVTWFPFQQVGMRNMPVLDTREVRIEVELDQNYDIDMASDLFRLLQESMEAQREELGIKNVLTFYESGRGSVEAYLYTEDDGPMGVNPKYNTQDVMNILSARLGKLVPGAELRVSMAESDTGGDRGVTLRLRGDDAGLLHDYAEQFKVRMARIEQLHDVETDVEKTKQEMQIRIDEPLAKQAGIPPLAIAQTVDAALRGARLPEMKQGSREIPVWAQFQEEDRESRTNLENVTVANAEGRLVPLNQLVNLTRSQSPSSIHRVNGKNVVTLRAKTTGDDMMRVQQALRDAIDSFELPVGYSIEFGEELTELDDNVLNFASTMLMAVLLIYMVMAALFESYLLPLSIMTSVPLSLLGAVWSLYLTGTQLDTVTFIGCVVMSGLIVNNGIVIVDHINNLRKAGHSRFDAIMMGGQDRYRPVIMTALTTILGIIPLALSDTGGAATFSGLGRALIGGMSMGTVLTLYVVPLFYTLIDDFQEWCSAFIESVRPGGRAALAKEQP
jgi:HAE1 family hydrophobic/amphiphilic exporter-1